MIQSLSGRAVVVLQIWRGCGMFKPAADASVPITTIKPHEEMSSPEQALFSTTASLTHDYLTDDTATSTPTNTASSAICPDIQLRMHSVF